MCFETEDRKIEYLQKLKNAEKLYANKENQDNIPNEMQLRLETAIGNLHEMIDIVENWGKKVTLLSVALFVIYQPSGNTTQEAQSNVSIFI